MVKLTAEKQKPAAGPGPLRRVIKWASLLLLAYLIALLVQMPAGWLVSRLPVPAEVTLNGTSGTLWQGSAAELNYQQVTLRQLQWRLAAERLWRGELALDLRAEGDLRLRGRVGVRLGPGGITLLAEQLLVDTHAPRLVSWLQLPLPLETTGPLSLNLRHWTLPLGDLTAGDSWCQALDGELWWMDASGSSFGQSLQLGDLNAALSCVEGGSLQAVINGEGGQVLPELRATLTADGQAEVNGFLLPGQQMSSGVRSLLGMIGRPDSQGRWPVRLRQRLL